MRTSRALTIGVLFVSLALFPGRGRSIAAEGFVPSAFEPALDPARPVVLGGAITYLGRAIRVRVDGPLRVVRGGREVEARDGIVTLLPRDRLEPTADHGEFSLVPLVRATQPSTALAGVVARPRITVANGSEGSACPYLPSLDTEEDPSSLVSVDAGIDVAGLSIAVLAPDGSRRDLRRMTGRTATFRLVAQRSVRPTSDPNDPAETLEVRLGDRLAIEGPVNGVLDASSIVGGGRCAPRRLRLAIHVVLPEAGASPPIGMTRAAVDANVAAMLDDASRVLGACGVALDVPTPRMRIVAPPAPARIAIADGDGLPTLAASELVLLVEGRRVSAAIPAGSTPVATANLLSVAVRDAGFDATVVRLPRLSRAADASADVIIRRRNREPATLSPLADTPLLGDHRQRLAIGRVDFADGLQAMDTDFAAIGTLEERTLLGGVVDGDAMTIDVVIIDSFDDPSRMGEAFVARDHGPWTGTVVLTREAVAHHAAILTLPHEVGHLLLDDPYHPDTTTVGRFTRVMASTATRDASAPSVFAREDCDRMRRRGARFFAPD